VIGAIALAVVALVGAGAAGPALQAVQYRPRGPLLPAEVEDLRRLDAPTRGDLAGDLAYQATVRRSWTEKYGTGRYRPHGNGFEEVRGEPRLLWAGTTPAGPAAVVGQLIRYQHRNKTEFRQDQLLLGAVATGEGGRPVVVAAGSRDVFWTRDGGYHQRTPLMSGFFVGVDRSVLLVLDTGAPTGYALASRPVVGQEFTPLEFHDGVAVVPLPPQPYPPAVAVARLPFGGDHDLMRLGNQYRTR
jgi:hypothetical protein